MTGIFPIGVMDEGEMLLPLAWRLGASGTRTVFCEPHLGHLLAFSTFSSPFPLYYRFALRGSTSEKGKDLAEFWPLRYSRLLCIPSCGWVRLKGEGAPTTVRRGKEKRHRQSGAVFLLGKGIFSRGDRPSRTRC